MKILFSFFFLVSAAHANPVKTFEKLSEQFAAISKRPKVKDFIGAWKCEGSNQSYTTSGYLQLEEVAPGVLQSDEWNLENITLKENRLCGYQRSTYETFVYCYRRKDKKTIMIEKNMIVSRPPRGLLSHSFNKGMMHFEFSKCTSVAESELPHRGPVRTIPSTSTYPSSSSSSSSTYDSTPSSDYPSSTPTSDSSPETVTTARSSGPSTAHDSNGHSYSETSEGRYHRDDGRVCYSDGDVLRCY